MQATSYKKSFKNPKCQHKPNWRDRSGKKSYDFTSPVLESAQDQGGFAKNLVPATWFCSPKVGSRNFSCTEYRDRFVSKSFHHNEVPISTWTLKKTKWLE